MLTARVMDVSHLMPPASGSGALPLAVWPQRQARIQRYQSEKDRRLAQGAGLLAYQMLQEAGATDFSLGYGEAGKPYLTGHPDLHFNLSHSGRWAACAISHRPVGIDVEMFIPYDPALADFALSRVELDWLSCQPDPSCALTRLWVRKESYFKCLGNGLTLPLKDYSFIPGEEARYHHYFTEKQTQDACVCLCSPLPEKVLFL